MSNYYTTGKHPITGKLEKIEMIDDYYGRHMYGARFPNGETFRAIMGNAKVIDYEVVNDRARINGVAMDYAVVEDNEVVSDSLN